MVFFFFNDTATTEIYTLSLHDALPICEAALQLGDGARRCRHRELALHGQPHPLALSAGREPALRHPSRHRSCRLDRKSTRLNSSHANISYAVFCLKKKKILT